jgi:hypothetical protein
LLILLWLLATALAGYDQLFIAVCVRDKGTVKFGIGVRPVGTTFLAVSVAVGAAWREGISMGGKIARDDTSINSLGFRHGV